MLLAYRWLQLEISMESPRERREHFMQDIQRELCFNDSDNMSDRGYQITTKFLKEESNPYI
jgi:hypothetical protein